MGPIEWILLFTLGALWGLSFVLSKVALRELPPFTLVFVRLTLTSLLLYAWLRATGVPLRQPASAWRAFLVMGFLNILVPYVCTAWGQMRLPAGLASIMTSSTPLFTVRSRFSTSMPFSKSFSVPLPSSVLSTSTVSFSAARS